MEWQPIETAPRDQDILIFEPEKYSQTIAVVKWDADNYVWRESTGEHYAIYDPTHWMPLPEPPRIK